MFRKADFVFVVAVLLIALASLACGPWLIAEPPIVLSRDISPLSPRLFPTIVLVGIVIVAVAFIVNRVRGTDALWVEAERVSAVAGRRGLKRLLMFLALVVICALVLDDLGFLTTMFVLMVATSILVGNDNLPQIIAISVGLPLAIYVIVTHFLRTALPELDALESGLAPILALLPSF